MAEGRYRYEEGRALLALGLHYAGLGIAHLEELRLDAYPFWSHFQHSARPSIGHTATTAAFESVGWVHCGQSQPGIVCTLKPLARQVILGD